MAAPIERDLCSGKTFHIAPLTKRKRFPSRTIGLPKPEIAAMRRADLAAESTTYNFRRLPYMQRSVVEWRFSCIPNNRSFRLQQRCRPEVV
jgi:hypothetical protein